MKLDARGVVGAATLKWRLLAGLLGVVLLLFLCLILAPAALDNGSSSATANCGPVGVGAAPGTIQWPMHPGTYRISSGYGPRTGGFHHGVDFAAPLNTPVYAAADGVVRKAGPASGFGDWIVLDHHAADGSLYSTVYGHEYPDGLEVTEGQTVSAGQKIARSGNNGESTGPHMHFEVWIGGRLDGGTDTDPIPWLNANAGQAPTTVQPVAQAPPPPSPGAGDDALTGPVPPAGRQATMTIGPEQQTNIDKIVGVVKGQGLPLRVAVIAVATAMQESSLRVIDYGDLAGPDSRGLFQQRTPWGPYDVRMDPAGSTGLFLNGGRGGQKGLLSKDWAHQSLEAVVVSVQISVGGYAKWETQAEQLVAAATGVDPITAGLPACTIA